MFVPPLFIENIYTFCYHSRSIDPTEALKKKGVVAFISAETVQSLNGFNECGVFAGDYPIFATDRTRYVGQMIGMVLAEKAGQARKAAKLYVTFTRGKNRERCQLTWKYVQENQNKLIVREGRTSAQGRKAVRSEKDGS